MLLPPNEAKYFSYYISNHKITHDKNFREICYDTIDVFFEKRINLGFFKYTKKWKKRYKIFRYQESNAWKLTKGAITFLKQLKELQDQKWYKVDSKLYKKIQEEHPEYFL